MPVALKFAESGYDPGVGGPDRRQQAADDSHCQREENTAHKQFGRVFEGKRQARNVCHLIVAVVRSFSGRTATQPTGPPIKDIRKTSNKNGATTSMALKRRARMVAISWPRSATAEYLTKYSPRAAAPASASTGSP